jgi:hypothetical protein
LFVCKKRKDKSIYDFLPFKGEGSGEGLMIDLLQGGVR